MHCIGRIFLVCAVLVCCTVTAFSADGVQRVEILGGEYFFKPNVLVVKVNQPVELTLKKTPGIVPHAFVVHAPEAGITIAASFNRKKPRVITFTPTKVGTYPMYCDKRLLLFESHRQRGMEGVIEVTP